MSSPRYRRRRSATQVRVLPTLSKRRLVALIVVVLVAFGSFTGFRLFQLAKSISPHTGLGDVIGLAQNQDDVPGTLAYRLHHGDRVNILLLGYGGDGHDGAYLTDSIMMISVQGADRVALTSLPRDSYAEMKVLANGGEYDGKINAAYEIPLDKSVGKPAPEYDTGFEGAGKLASKIIGDYLGVNIDYWVGVDFTAFKKVVDALGGVDVNVPTVLDDTEYPTSDFGYQHIHFNPGMQHMDGSRALIYVRERHADNDFGRSRRQQQLTALIKDKMSKPSVISKMYDLMDALKNNVHTNMSLNDLKVFGAVSNKVSNAATHHVSIDATNWQYETYGYDGAYLLMARDGTRASLHKYIQQELVDPAVLAEKARVQFSSTPAEASRGENFAGIVASTMGMLNFNVAAPATSYLAAPPATVVHDYSGGRAAATAAWMAQYFGGTVVTEDPSLAPPAPEASPAPGGDGAKADLVVALGRDFAEQFDASVPSTAPARPYYGPNDNRPYGRPTYRPAPRASAAPTSAPTQQPAPQPTAPPPPPKPICPPVCPSPKPGGLS
ncbi:MAG: LCP family protein [Candidatus Dormibacteria bacterium]